MRVMLLLDLREAPATWDWRATDEKRDIREAAVIREPNARKSNLPTVSSPSSPESRSSSLVPSLPTSDAATASPTDVSACATPSSSSSAMAPGSEGTLCASSFLHVPAAPPPVKEIERERERSACLSVCLSHYVLELICRSSMCIIFLHLPVVILKLVSGVLRPR